MCVQWGQGWRVFLGHCHPGLPPPCLPQAAQLEAARPPRLRYLLVVSTREHLSQDETVLLGVDFPDSRWEQGKQGRGERKGDAEETVAFLLSPASSSSCTLGLVLPLWSDTQVYLDGDG